MLGLPQKLYLEDSRGAWLVAECWDQRGPSPGAMRIRLSQDVPPLLGRRRGP